MAGNVRVLKEMVSGLERGQTRMEMFGTITDKFFHCYSASYTIERFISTVVSLS